MIRRAGLEDAEMVARQIGEFHAVSPWKDFPFDLAATTDFVESLLRDGVVFVSEDGMIGGLLHPLYFNPKYIVAAEMFWWAPKGGRALRQAFEAWAEEAGADAVQMGGLANDRAETIARLYARSGYQPTETCFTKRLK